MQTPGYRRATAYCPGPDTRFNTGNSSVNIAAQSRSARWFLTVPASGYSSALGLLPVWCSIQNISSESLYCVSQKSPLYPRHVTTWAGDALRSLCRLSVHPPVCLWRQWTLIVWVGLPYKINYPTCKITMIWRKENTHKQRWGKENFVFQPMSRRISKRWEMGPIKSVSYTHLTLPTNREV